jgi:hypothetical protein
MQKASATNIGKGATVPELSASQRKEQTEAS